MGVLKRIVKPKSHKGKRELIKREPKLIENVKQCIFLKGTKCSESVHQCLKDLAKIKKPHSVFFGRKNDYRPFESTIAMENFCRKSDSSLFAFGSHNKKRPNNLILGRLFDYHILDMVEFGLENFKSLEDFKNAKFTLGSKPCLLFSGDAFQNYNSDFFRIKNLFIDFFHGLEVENIRLEGLEQVISFVVNEDTIYVRSYKIHLKKSGDKNPYVDLEEIGPSFDLTLRRTKLASSDLFKTACRVPKELKPKKVKNISKDVFGSKMGRIHVGKQELSKLNLRKMKGLKKTKAEGKVDRANRARENNTANEYQDQDGNANNSSAGSASVEMPMTTKTPANPLNSITTTSGTMLVHFS